MLYDSTQTTLQISLIIPKLIFGSGRLCFLPDDDIAVNIGPLFDVVRGDDGGDELWMMMRARRLLG